MNCEPLKNPLNREGTSQRQRLLSSLLPESIKVDERSLADLVAYALKYSEELKFYNLDNEVEGDWKAFIEQDVTTLFTLIQRRDPKIDQEDFKAQLALIRENPSAQTPAELRKLFDILHGMLREMDQWFSQTLDEFRLKDELRGTINPYMKAVAETIVAYEKAAETGLSSYLMHDFTIFGEVWELFPAQIPADSVAFGGGGADDAEIVAFLDIAEERMERLMQPLFDHFTHIIHKAPKYLEQSLEEFPRHEMHFSLLLAFLQLFRLLQDEMNTLTERHMEFYFKEVLQLSERPAEADHAHLVFTLARNINSHLIEKGTRFKAGKDALGKDVFFELTEDLIVNRAEVDCLKTVFLDKIRQKRLAGGTCVVTEKVRNVYHAPIANSSDGIGGPLDENEPKWKTVGEDQSTLAQDARTMADADVGFALASPILVLNEGYRRVRIRLTFESNSFLEGFFKPFFRDAIRPWDNSVTPTELVDLGNLMAEAFMYEFSGAEEWIEPTFSQTIATERPSVIFEEDVPSSTSPVLPRITFELPFRADKPPITYYNAEVLGMNFGTEWPVARFKIKPDSNLCMFEFIRHLRLRSAKIEVDVKSLTNLSIQNDLGPVDASKPFLPFGVQPVIGSSFYLGNAEVFSKRLTELNVNIQWLDAPPDFAEHYDKYGVPEIPGPCTIGNNTAHHNKSFTANLLVLKDFFWQNLNIPTYVTASDGDPVYGPSYANIPSPPPVRGDGVGLVYTPLGVSFVPNSCAGPNGISGVYLFHQVTTGPDADARNVKNIKVPATVFSGVKFGRDVELREIDRYRPNTKRGYMKLELNSPDFQHRAFPRIFTEKVVAAANSAPLWVAYWLRVSLRIRLPWGH
ncbi:MAG: hypothetical protein AAF570_01555 [Bacteroidota bacterium]